MKTMVDFDGEDLSEPIVEVLLACWMLWEVNQDICEPKDQGRYIDGVANFAFVQMILALKSFIDAAAAFSFLIVTKDHATRMHLLFIIPNELYEGFLKIYYAYIAWSYVMTTSHPEQVGFGADFLLQSFGLVSFLILANFLFWGINLIIQKEIKRIILKLFLVVSYLILGTIFI